MSHPALPRRVAAVMALAILAGLAALDFAVTAIRDRLVQARVAGERALLSGLVNDYNHWTEAFERMRALDMAWIMDNYASGAEGVRGGGGARALARDAQAAAAEPFAVMDREVRVSLAQGLALRDGPDGPLSELVRRADLAMYRAKRGRAGAARLHRPGSDEAPAGPLVRAIPRSEAAGPAGAHCALGPMSAPRARPCDAGSVP
jgi:GGDEF domain-containing protein